MNKYFMTFRNEGRSEVGLVKLEEQRVELETLRNAVEWAHLWTGFPEDREEVGSHYHRRLRQDKLS